jgi:prepilin peptidase CpaA
MSLTADLIAVAGAIILVAAALHDAAFRTVPNTICFAVLCCGLVARFVSGQTWPAIAAGAVTFIVAALCWRRGWLGGGDVKLLAASTLLVPPTAVPLLIAWVALSGGMLTIPYLLARHRLPLLAGPQHSLLGRIARAESWRLRRGGPLPYAVAIAAGAALVIASEHATVSGGVL